MIVVVIKGGVCVCLCYKCVPLCSCEQGQTNRWLTRAFSVRSEEDALFLLREVKALINHRLLVAQERWLFSVTPNFHFFLLFN